MQKDKKNNLLSHFNSLNSSNKCESIIIDELEDKEINLHDKIDNKFLPPQNDNNNEFNQINNNNNIFNQTNNNNFLKNTTINLSNKLSKNIDIVSNKNFESNLKTNFNENKNDTNLKIDNQEENTNNKKENNLKKNVELQKSLIIETPNYDLLQTENLKNEENNLSNKKDKQTKKRKFRFKLITAIFSVLTLIGLGWVIENSIAINNINNSIQSTEYQISEIQYLIKISQLDNFEEVTNNEPNAITSIIEINPPKLFKPTEIQPQTNWFDKFCNWISNIFT